MKWINSEMLILIDAVDFCLPTGRDQWKRVATHYHKNDKK